MPGKLTSSCGFNCTEWACLVGLRGGLGPAHPDQEIAALRPELAATKAQLSTAAVQIEHLRMQLSALRRQRYGRSSERPDAAIVQLELQVEDLEESEAGRQASLPVPLSGSEAAELRARLVRNPLPDHLPRETVVQEPAIMYGCACDRSKLARLGEDFSEVLENIPARLKVIRHVRPRYACHQCEQVFQARALHLPIERGRDEPGLIAHVAVSKIATAHRCIASRPSWRARGWRSTG